MISAADIGKLLLVTLSEPFAAPNGNLYFSVYGKLTSTSKAIFTIDKIRLKKEYVTAVIEVASNHVSSESYAVDPYTNEISCADPVIYKAEDMKDQQNVVSLKRV